MLKYSVVLLLFLVLLFSNEINETNSTQQNLDDKRITFIFHNAMRDFRHGSYYQALDEFDYIAKFPQSPYYLQTLFMLAKIYLYIGKRLGDKKYLWTAINYLNLYLAKGGKKDYDFYRLKANIYENLGFYERAFALYKLALGKIDKKNQELPIIMGLLRTAVWLQRIDLATKYLLLLSIENLSTQEQKELIFLQGMYYFAKKDYDKAIEFFKKTYKDFESFLIENPPYYYLVAETAYRIGNLQFAQMLFRRILTYIKNKQVVQKAILRLGDIKFLQKDYKSSANYYIRLIKDFPDSLLARVAKLKLLYIVEENKKIFFYLKKYMPNSDFLQDPLRFIVRTLVKYRNSYIGIFALANFGLESFLIENKKLYKRLSWEISLISPKKLKYEHIEYFRRLWSRYLLNTKNAKYICMLFEANPDFFYAIFDSNILYKIASYLHKCKKETLRIELLKKLYLHNITPHSVMQYVKALYENKSYSKALQILQKHTYTYCDYWKLYAKVCFMANASCQEIYKKVHKYCPANDLYSDIFNNIFLMNQNKIATNFLQHKKDELAKKYKEDRVIKKFVIMFAQKLLERENYKELIQLLNPIAKNIQNDCLLNSILSLSYVRIGKIDYAEQVLNRVKKCKNIWYKLAKFAIEDSKIEEAVRNENVGNN